MGVARGSVLVPSPFQQLPGPGAPAFVPSVWAEPWEEGRSLLSASGGTIVLTLRTLGVCEPHSGAAVLLGWPRTAVGRTRARPAGQLCGASWNFTEVRRCPVSPRRPVFPLSSTPCDPLAETARCCRVLRVSESRGGWSPRSPPPPVRYMALRGVPGPHVLTCFHVRNMFPFELQDPSRTRGYRKESRILELYEKFTLH